MTPPSRFPRMTILPRRHPPARSAGWWAVVLPLALMMASDYKLRSRDVDQAVGGSADLTVLVEIAIYGSAALYLYYRFGLRPPRRRTTGLLLVGFCVQTFLSLFNPRPVLTVERGELRASGLQGRRRPERRHRTFDVDAHAAQQPAFPEDHDPGAHRHRQQQHRHRARDRVTLLPEVREAAHPQSPSTASMPYRPVWRPARKRAARSAPCA